jgi:ATP-dependent DNA ligase
MRPMPCFSSSRLVPLRGIPSRSEECKKYLADLAKDFVSPMQPIFEFGPEIDLETATNVVRQTKIEGLVAKRLGSRHQPGIESDHWLKQRFNQEDKFFVGRLHNRITRSG